MSPETGAADRWVEGVSGQLPPSLAGDLGALAATIPGVTMTPVGPSILGAGPAANLTTLNGLGTNALSVPRAARTQTRVTGATFDPTRGGFAGANIDVRLGPGSRDFQERSAFFTLEPASLQFDAGGRRGFGTRSDGAVASFGANGELIRRALTYNVALDLARRETDGRSLFSSERASLLQAGLSPDSVARLAALAPSIGLPLRDSGSPQRLSITWLGRFDDTRDSLDTRAVTTYVSRTAEDAVGVSPFTAASAFGHQTASAFGLQATWRAFTGPGRRVLSESRAALSREATIRTPFVDLPAASVTVRSPSNAPYGGSEVATVSMGGASYIASRDDRWTVEGANETLWNWRGARHRFKSLLWGRLDGLREQPAANRLGTFSFGSMDDLAAGRASSFTRTLTQPERVGRTWNLATAVAHEWVPSRYASVIYGARVEANGFGSAPARNVALEEALGVRSGVAPSRLHVSPRLGFTYTYNRDKNNGAGQMFNPIGQFNRGMNGVVRGGIGEFRGLFRPEVIADVSAATGLAGATTALACVGEAVPTVEWTRFGADPTSIPTDCASGGGVLVERAPSVTLVDPAYDAPRSWRASVNWTTNVRKWVVQLSTLGSYDLAQPGVRDVNFAGVSYFELGGEGNRPVYVSESAIDARTGTVSAVQSRRSADYGRVSVRTSDLRGYGGQVTIGVAPDLFRLRSRIQFFASANYTLQATRREYRGFDGAAFGDPRVTEWAPSAGDATHAVVLSGGVSHRRTGTVTLFGRLQSGLPFTPIVQGDVNGDGRGGDRAYIPPTTAGADPLSALRAGGSAVARACLKTFAGQVAARNGCRGPWTHTLNMQWVPPVPRRWARRLTPRVYFQNVLGGIDQLLYGSNGLRGWGSQVSPDAVLLIPRGFDPVTRAFRYDVNSRFGETRPSRVLARTPFRISIDVAMDLSVPYPVQRLRRALEPVRGPSGHWQRRSADSITAYYLRSTSSVHRLLLSNSDSLFLSGDQIRRLRIADSVFSEEVRSIYRPLGEYLAGIPDEEPGKPQLERVTATERAYWQVFWKQVPIADSIVTPTQRSLIPMFEQMVRTPEDRRNENSRYQFGESVPLRPRP
ncbi:MAG TPA: hypothetical protein VGD77_07065 [Gemmatimonadaceae bacterium]